MENLINLFGVLMTMAVNLLKVSFQQNNSEFINASTSTATPCEKTESLKKSDETIGSVSKVPHKSSKSTNFQSSLLKFMHV